MKLMIVKNIILPFSTHEDFHQHAAHSPSPAFIQCELNNSQHDASHITKPKILQALLDDETKKLIVMCVNRNLQIREKNQQNLKLMHVFSNVKTIYYRHNEQTFLVSV